MVLVWRMTYVQILQAALRELNFSDAEIAERIAASRLEYIKKFGSDDWTSIEAKFKPGVTERQAIDDLKYLMGFIQQADDETIGLLKVMSESEIKKQIAMN